MRNIIPCDSEAGMNTEKCRHSISVQEMFRFANVNQPPFARRFVLYVYLFSKLSLKPSQDSKQTKENPMLSQVISDR